MPSRRLSPAHADVLLAVAALAEFSLELVLVRPTPHLPVAIACLTASAASLAVRRRAPLVTMAATYLATMAATYLALLVLTLLSPHYTDMAGPFFASFVAGYALGRYAGPRALVAGATLGIAVQGIGHLVTPNDAGDYVFGLSIGVVAPVLLGRLLRTRAALNRALREQTEALARARGGTADRAVAEERARIAGELHDVVAHSLSAMTVQASAAHRLTAAAHAGAGAGFATVEATGREALDELRRLLGVLRLQDAELALAPQPSLRHLSSLVSRSAAAGLPVALDLEGPLPELPAGIDLTAYRVVQGALAGAREAGGAGRAEVRVRVRPDALEVSVLDDGRERPLGGIRERVELHGGRLTAGPRGAGGHAVRARLPFDGAAPEPRGEPVPTCPATASKAAVRRARGIVIAIRRLEPVAVDRTIAAAAAVLGIAEVLTSRDLSGPPVLNALVAIAYTAPLAWRRRAPLPALAATLVAAIAMGAALTSLLHLFVPYGAILLLAFACGSRPDRRPALTAAATMLAGVPIVVVTMPSQTFPDFFFPTCIVLGIWTAGRVVRSRTALTEQLHETAARLAEEQEAEAQLAAGEERRRIAREMHDLVAHSMSVMVVQAGGARRILARDAGRALEAAVRIERTGREALTEMRHLLGVLHPGAEHPLAPQPTLAELDALVERARAAGLPAVLAHRGERHPLPAGLDLAAYRIVQEALTNALKHAHGAATEVTVDWARDAIALEVRDSGGGSAAALNGGHGLVGMRERVRLYGGELDTGPLPGGGWRVRATLPCAEREAVAA